MGIIIKLVLQRNSCIALFSKVKFDSTKVAFFFNLQEAASAFDEISAGTQFQPILTDTEADSTR